jgi:hypothetical protein
MAKHLYLRKANDQLISQCQCDNSDALISSPCQMDCPWCRCGWLFTCSRCRKAFTFAEAFEVNETWEDTADRTIRAIYQREPEPGEIKEWVGFIQLLLRDIQRGDQYVYFDGWVFPTTAEGIRVEGWHSMHDLDFIPHVAALDNPDVTDSLLSSKGYWLSAAIEQDA